MRLAPRSLFGRNLLLLTGMILLGQLLAGLIFFVLVQKPRSGETADMLSQNLVAVRDGLAALPAAARADFVARFNARALAAPLPQDTPERRLLPAERLLVRSISDTLAAQGIEAVWRRERGALLVRITLDDAPYWLAATGPDFGTRPRLSGLFSWLAGLAIALIGALLIQRRINRPLTELAAAARAVEAGEAPPALPEDGPTEIATLAGRFNRMQAALADRERTRALMLAGISHDLRTPLTKLRLSVELLGDPPAQAADPTLLASMAGSCRRIDAIISQFIDFARLDETVALEPLDLDALVAEALAACAGAETVQVLLPAGLSVLGHAPALVRLLTNLLDNALKHGAPPVAVEARTDDDTVMLVVRDAGPGIAADALTRLRQPFARGNASRGGPAGTGLGLAIADHIAARHGTALAFARPSGGGVEVQLQLTRAH